MIRYKRLLLFTFILTLCFVSAIHAEPVDTDTAFRAAETYLYQTTPEGAQKNASNNVISQVKAITSPEDTPLAWVAELESGGFVILSGDTDVEPVLGYSPSGRFSFEDTPGNILLSLVKSDMQARLASLPVIAQKSPAHAQSNNAAWERFLSGDITVKKSAENEAVWGPLLTTDWHQYSPYNDLCPLDPQYMERCVSGCVATAYSQILNYWKFPKQMTFDESDAYEKDDIKIPADSDELDFPSFEELNDALADIEYDGDETEIAYLTFAVGIKCEMRYSKDISGAPVHANTFREMGFESAAMGGSWDKFRQQTIDDIKQGFPVAVGITSTQYGELMHEVVFDGYNENEDLFHVNMGQGEHNNIWYDCPPIYSQTNYDIFDSIIYNIYPPGTGHGTITGRVLSSSEQPLANAFVETTPGHYMAVSGDDGVFSIDVTVDGEYTLQASRADHIASGSGAVTVSQGTETSAGDITLEPAISPTVVHYRFDGDGSDESDNGFDATVNTEETEWADGLHDGALSVTDRSLVVEVPGAGASYPGFGDWTIEILEQRQETLLNQVILYHSSCQITTYDHQIHFIISDGVRHQELAVDFPIGIEEWCHVAAVYTYMESMELYVNGNLLGKAATSIVPEAAAHENAHICGSRWDSVIVDEFRISAAALTPEEFIGSPATGTIAGIVTDSETGAAVVGANVSILNGNYSAVTDENGAYILPQVSNITEYTLTALIDGYKKYRQGGIKVVGGETTSIDVALVQGGDFERISVTDVPDDNGKQVYVSWYAHVYDTVAAGDSAITKYSVWREVDRRLLKPTSTEVYDWEKIMEIPAEKLEQYQVISPIIYDYSEELYGMFELEFMIKAHSSDPQIVYESEAVKGHSIDNTDPGPVTNINATWQDNTIELTWSPSPAEDIFIYELYKVSDADVEIVDFSYLFGTTTETFYVDTDPTPGAVYKIAVIDDGGNRVITTYELPSTNVEESPEEFSVSAAYPNPFNSSMTIRYVLPNECRTKITVYDITGREIAVLSDNVQGPGIHYAVWDGRDRNGVITASGMYLYKVTAGINSQNGKALYIR